MPNLQFRRSTLVCVWKVTRTAFFWIAALLSKQSETSKKARFWIRKAAFIETFDSLIWGRYAYRLLSHSPVRCQWGSQAGDLWWKHALISIILAWVFVRISKCPSQVEEYFFVYWHAFRRSSYGRNKPILLGNWLNMIGENFFCIKCSFGHISCQTVSFYHRSYMFAEVSAMYCMKLGIYKRKGRCGWSGWDGSFT